MERKDLEKVRILAKEVKRKRESIAKLESRVTGGAVKYDGIKVQTSPTSQEGLLATLADMSDDLKREEDRLREMREEIIKHFQILKGPEKEIMMLRYISCMSWDDIIDSVYYSRTQCFRYYQEALERISEER